MELFLYLSILTDSLKGEKNNYEKSGCSYIGKKHPPDIYHPKRLFNIEDICSQWTHFTAKNLILHVEFSSTYRIGIRSIGQSSG